MITIQNISKTYKGKVNVKALQGITLTLDKGVYALLGPNGAGKSTLMKILTLSMRPDSGEVLWDGCSIARCESKYRSILGYMPQQQTLYNGFRGRTFLNYMAVLKDLPKQTIQNEIARVSENVNLLDKLDEKIAGYSGGMKQRLLLASAIMGSPQFVILDEPTAGLDPRERVRTRRLAKRVSERSTVLFATHVVSDIEEIADKVIILCKGEVVAFDTPINLIKATPDAQNLEDVYMYYFGRAEDELC